MSEPRDPVSETALRPGRPRRRTLESADTGHTDLYGSEYYDVYIGRAGGEAPPPYRWGESVWEAFFGRIAAELVRQLGPQSALDAGCAVGFLVKALRDRGVDAEGVDASAWAIAQVPEPTKSHCREGSVTDEFLRDYDLITCIEVLEHLEPMAAVIAVANMCRHAKAVLFSSTADCFEEVTHINIHPPDYWAGLFAQHGFYRDWDCDAGFVSAQAVLFRPVAQWPSVVSGYERRHWDTQREIAGLRTHRDHLFSELQRDLGARDELSAVLNTKTFRLRSRVRSLWGQHGPAMTVAHPPAKIHSYAEWVQRFDTPTQEDYERLHQRLKRLGHATTFSVLMPVFNPSLDHLRAAIESVLAQVYPEWQLCVADDASLDPAVVALLNSYRDRDRRVRIAAREARGHIAAATNSALDLADGEFIALLDQDDIIPKHALACMAIEVDRHPAAAILFSDEDKLDAAGQRTNPYFKPPWNEELLLGQNYLSHLGAYSRDLVLQVGGFRQGVEGSQDHDLALRVSELISPDQIHHLPTVLYHWRSHPDSVASSASVKPYAHSAGRRAVQEHLERSDAAANVAASHSWSGMRVRRPPPQPPPKVRVLVGGRDPGQRERSLTSLRLLTDYPNLAIEQAAEAAPFFTADDGASTQAGVPHEGPGQLGRPDEADAICALASGVEAIEATWLSEMVALLFSSGVGMVGARLEDQGGSIVKGPLAIGADGSLTPTLDGLGRLEPGYFGRPWLTHSVAALPPGAFLVRRIVLQQLGGLDPALDGYWRAVELSLGARSRGWRVVWTPAARLSAAGALRLPSPAQLPATLRERYSKLLESDPSYNRNLSLDPGRAFQPAWPPRGPRLWESD
ncbi:MAG: glycosyltransferase [Candidatus Dormibacteria bacterium]